MKRNTLIICSAICISIILSVIVGILINSIGDNRPSPLTPEDAETIYINSLAAIGSAQDKVLTVNTREEINFNGSVFTENLERTETYNNIGTGSPIIRIDEQMNVGKHSISNCEIYTDDTAYLTIAGSKFVADCTQETLSKRLTPSILFDTTLYSEISGVNTGKDYKITFGAPISPEAWLSISDGTLLSAGGTAKIGYNNQLISCTYDATYLLGTATVNKTITVAMQFVRNEIAMPDDLSAYIPISYIDGPRMLERISGFLTQTECVSSAYTDSIYFGALGDKREQSITLHAYKDTQWSASVQTDIVLSNDSYENQQTVHKKQEVFINNTYSVKTDDSTPAMNPDITEADLQQYLQNLLLSTVMLPKYIAFTEVEENDSTLYIKYVGTEAFAAFLRENAGSILYQDSELLNTADTSIDTIELIGHLTLDKQTGLPLSSGINYSASYTTEGLPYQLHYRAEQKYTLANSETITNINKAAGN